LQRGTKYRPLPPTRCEQWARAASVCSRYFPQKSRFQITERLVTRLTCKGKLVWKVFAFCGCRCLRRRGEGKWWRALYRVVPAPLRRVPPRCERHSSAERGSESGPPALVRYMPPMFHCRVTVRAGWAACYRDSLLARLLLAACNSSGPRQPRSKTEIANNRNSSCVGIPRCFGGTDCVVLTCLAPETFSH